jgi:hypothetical protein
MKTKWIPLVTLVAYVFMISPLAQAREKDLVSSFELLQNEAYNRFSGGSEYLSGQEPGTVMMKVNLWGAVRKPGIHHIPVKTDLIALMSYAGGPDDKAMMDTITIKRQQGNKHTKIKVDLARLIHGEGVHDLTLQPDDIVVVPAREPWISQDTFTLAIFASTIASILLSAVLIDNNTR